MEGSREGEALAQINSPERHIIVLGFRQGGAERYEKLKGCQFKGSGQTDCAHTHTHTET